jgi:hypothetical protein
MAWQQLNEHEIKSKCFITTPIGNDELELTVCTRFTSGDRTRELSRGPHLCWHSDMPFLGHALFPKTEVRYHQEWLGKDMSKSILQIAS